MNKSTRVNVTINDPGLVEKLESMGRFEKSAFVRRGLLAVMRLEAQGYTVDDQGRVGRLLDGLERDVPSGTPTTGASGQTVEAVKPDAAMQNMLDQF